MLDRKQVVLSFKRIVVKYLSSLPRHYKGRERWEMSSPRSCYLSPTEVTRTATFRTSFASPLYSFAVETLSKLFPSPPPNFHPSPLPRPPTSIAPTQRPIPFSRLYELKRQQFDKRLPDIVRSVGEILFYNLSESTAGHVHNGIP